MHTTLILTLALGAAGATLTGGLFALRFRDHLHLILGFSAGAIIAVAFFDLMPEALNLGGQAYSASTVLSLTAAGFFGYAVLDRLIVLHADHGNGHGHRRLARGWAGASSLSAHSTMDGFAMGIAFQASAAIGAVVAVAVLAHDFSDGMNTVNLVVKSGSARRQAFGWLVVDAAAPVIGALASLFVPSSPALLCLLLATFAGFFLYIGASDLLPESHHAHPKFLTTVVTLLGAAILYGVIQLAG